jgi:MFS family permease
MQNPTAETKAPGYSWYALSLLMFVYVLNFLDRQIIYILFPLIKKEMLFTDTQLALLGGTSFVIFYTVLGIPFGRIADKGSRTKLIAIGLAIWSVFSGLTGFANGFWTLFACRVMVGVGEATLGPAAISLLADFFPPTKRATVTSIYSMGIAIGAGLAAIFGGYLSQYGWREAFFIVGFPGLVFSVLVFLLREPARSLLETSKFHLPPPPPEFDSDFKEIAQTIVEPEIKETNLTVNNKGIYSGPFILLCIGYGLFGLATNNIAIWGPTYFNRLFEVKLPIYGYWAGVAVLAAGIPATLFGGVIADWFRQKSKGGRMYYGALLSLVSIPCWLIILFTDNFTDNFYLILPSVIVLLFAALGWLGAAAADATEIAGANLRGVAVAIYFFTINIAAYLIGANLIGKLSDSLGGAENPSMMRYALLVCPICCLLGAVCLFLGGKSLEKQVL